MESSPEDGNERMSCVGLCGSLRPLDNTQTAWCPSRSTGGSRLLGHESGEPARLRGFDGPDGERSRTAFLNRLS